jgi:diketogulonate reductase-like aldo/keto reductase
VEYYRLNNGLPMPSIGFGTALLKPDVCEHSIITALECGYRSIDTANQYLNERAVGRAIHKSGLPREGIFLTTKLLPIDYGYEKTTKAIDATLKRLDTEYIDLLLLHWPYRDYPGAWKAMEEAVKHGKLKAIGISNFTLENLTTLIDKADILPAIAQVECHPYNQQQKLQAFLQPYGTHLEAWYPLGQGNKKLMGEEVFTRLAHTYGKSNTQIVLRWHLQSGHIVIPRSTNPAHMRENIDLFDFHLTDAEMNQIAALDKNKSFVPLPDFMKRAIFGSLKLNYDAQK